MARPARDSSLEPAALLSKANLALPGGRGGVMALVSALTALLTTNSGVNWGREAGVLWNNSAISIGLKWYSTTVPEAPFCVSRKRSDGAEEVVPDHPLTLLLRQPRGTGKRGGAALPASNLWAATVLSLKVDGNAYWVLRRNEYTKRVVAIEYIPHWYIEPRWDSDEEYISSYEYRIASRSPQTIPVEDVIHFRDGLDPENTRKGLSPLKALLKEVVSDNEATGYTAAILKNMGIPGVIITPKPTTGEKVIKGTSTGFKERVKEMWDQVTRGDQRGKAVIFDDPFDINMPGWSPEQLALDRIRQVPEARLIAALQIPAMVVGLSVGDNQRTYANMREAREMAYESSVLPLLSMLADTIQVQLLPQITGRGDETCGFDLTQVRVLQTDMAELWKRAGEAWRGGGITRAEYRAMLGYEVDETRDNVFFYDVSQSGQMSATQNQSSATQNQEGSTTDKSTQTTDSPAGKKSLPLSDSSQVSPSVARAVLLAHAAERRIKAERGEEEEAPPMPLDDALIPADPVNPLPQKTGSLPQKTNPLPQKTNPLPEVKTGGKSYLPVRRPNLFSSRN